MAYYSCPIILYFKKAIFIVLFSIGFLSVAHSQSSYQYECINVNKDGYTKIKIWNPQKGRNYKFDQSRKDAIDAVLFYGIPSNNGCILQKPLLQKQEEQEKFKKLEKEFFKTNGIWTKFTSSAETESALPENLGPKNWKVFHVSVAKDLLRKYLEENNIVKPLNEGF